MKTIFTGFSPNTTKKDLLTACSWLFLPWKWTSLRKGNAPKLVEKEITKYFGVEHSIAFDSGRSALFFALKSLGVVEGDEVLVQAYTCVVVVNAIKFIGAKPVYVDIKDDFNLDPTDMKSKIGNKTKVVIIQHTFGIPADLNSILSIAKDHNLKTIEDCAHVFGNKFNEKFLGTFADIGMFSFGSDKPISCGRGGAVITNDVDLAEQMKLEQERLPETSLLKVIQHLIHFPVFFLGKQSYNFFIGKLLLWVTKKLHITNRIIYKKEKIGKEVSFYPAKLPNALASILLNQIEIADKVREHRLEVSKFYQDNINNNLVKKPSTTLSYLRYPLLVDDPKKLHKFAKSKNIILGDWYQRVVAPNDVMLEKTGYASGDCPNAEKLAKSSVNLPTNQNTKEGDLKRVVACINKYAG